MRGKALSAAAPRRAMACKAVAARADFIGSPTNVVRNADPMLCHVLAVPAPM